MVDVTNHKFHVVLAAVALQATAACYPYWTGTALEERVAALENASAENRAQIDQTRRDLDKLQNTLDTLTKSATRTTAEVAAATDDLLRQVQMLRGELAESQFRSTEFLQRFEQVERRVAASKRPAIAASSSAKGARKEGKGNLSGIRELLGLP